MTGGLAYILRSESEQVLNQEFVQAHDMEDEEEGHLRRLLESHLALTDSPVAFRLLSRKVSLPFVRIQPIHFQGTLQTAWQAIPAIVQDSIPLAAANFLSVSASPAPHYA
jgi:glutamate synthase domain-containing protein 3